MAGFLRTLIQILMNWHKVELRRLRNSMAAVVVVPLLFIVPGMFLGGVSWQLKLAFIQMGIWLATFFLLWLSWRRLLIGVEIATLLENGKPKQSLVGDVRDGVDDYLRLVAGVLASEITAGFIALWLPAHKNPLIAALLFCVAMVFITYTIWQKGKLVWPKLVYRLAIFTLIASLASIFFAQTTNEVSNRLKPDERVANIVREILPTDQEKRERQAAVQEKKIEVTAYPDRYTGVSLPYYHWFDFGYEDDFQVKLIGVKDPFDFKVGQPKPSLGDKIPSSRLYLKSLAGKETRVKIFLRPKKEEEKMM